MKIIKKVLQFEESLKQSQKFKEKVINDYYQKN